MREAVDSLDFVARALHARGSLCERSGDLLDVVFAVGNPKELQPGRGQGRIGVTLGVVAAGTGNPFFTTDTAAALRAAEIEADALLKGTHSGVDGVYDSDPRTNPNAVKYDQIPYMDVMNKDLKVMASPVFAATPTEKR